LLVVILRLNLARRSQAEWPDFPTAQRRYSGALFEQRPALRKLNVLTDADVLTAPEDVGLRPEALLTGLLSHPYIRLLRYRDDGPPPGTPRRNCGPPVAQLSAADGWAELRPADRGEFRELTCAWVGGDGPVLTSIWAGGYDYARQDVRTSVYRDLDPAAAASRRERDVVATAVAAAAGADLFITGRPYLLAGRSSGGQGPTICTVGEALALVGLYLRAQREFIVWRGPGAALYLSGFYFWVGAWELLPEAWRWSSACGQHSRAANDDTLSSLCLALTRRLQRALEARDRLHRSLFALQTPETGRAVLGELDTILILLMAAVDVTSRIANQVLGINSRNVDTGWQKSGWRQRVAREHGALGALFEPGAPLERILTILKELRNTVHGQVLQSMLIHAGPQQGTAIRLPVDTEEKVLMAMDSGGGRVVWGVRTAAGRTVVDPGAFVEHLLPAVLELLNSVMQVTPVERLEHVQLTTAQCQPPPDEPGTASIFSERNRLSIRWQLGF